NGTSVTFYSNNDPSGATATRTIQSSQRVGDSDIRIGVLNNPLGSGFSFFEFATTEISSASDFQDSPYYLSDAYLVGRSPSERQVDENTVEPYSPPSQDMALGRNKLDGWYSSITTGGTTDQAMFSVVNSPPDDNFLDYEAALN